MIVILVVVLRDVVATRKSNGNRDSDVAAATASEGLNFSAEKPLARHSLNVPRLRQNLITELIENISSEQVEERVRLRAEDGHADTRTRQ